MSLSLRRILATCALLGLAFGLALWRVGSERDRFSPKAKSPALSTESESSGGPALPSDALRAAGGAAPDRAARPTRDRPDANGARGVALSGPELLQAQALERVLETRNDNAPELDRELRDPSPALRTYMRNRYRELSRERRNDQGTIVFLIARDPRTREDFDFLRDVVGQAPCLSLSDCAKAPGPGGAGEESHHSSLNSVTLAYPQLVALNRLEAYLSSGRADARAREWAVGVIRHATESRDGQVASKAREIARRMGSG